MNIFVVKIVIAIGLWILIVAAVYLLSFLITGLTEIFSAFAAVFQKIKVFWKT